jgi:hypothetical protein
MGLTVSATIEPRSELARAWIQNALSECVGGRLSSRKLVEEFCSASVSDATSQHSRRFTEAPYKDNSFFLDKTTFHSAPRKTLARITQKTHIDLTTGSRFWQQWAELLLRWSGSNRKSKTENQQ